MSTIQAIRSSKWQTLLHVEATYNQVVDAFGPPTAPVDTDKQWHCWTVEPETGGPTVEVYDYARHHGSKRPSDVPDDVVIWHVNATGPAHERGARTVANAINAWQPPPAEDGWVDPISGLDTYVRNERENGLVVAIEHDEHHGPAVSLGITEVWGGLDEATSHTLSPRMARRLAQLLTSAADHVEALGAARPAEGTARTAEQLCGDLYREVSASTDRKLVTSFTDAELADLVRHFQLHRCSTCNEFSFAVVASEIERRRTSTSPDAT